MLPKQHVATITTESQSAKPIANTPQIQIFKSQHIWDWMARKAQPSHKMSQTPSTQMFSEQFDQSKHGRHMVKHNNDKTDIQLPNKSRQL